LREENTVARLTEKHARSASEQLALLEELKAAAARLGFEVREEKLLREVGYRVRSGSCRVREKQVILLDRGLAPSAQIDILVDELAGRALEDVYLSPAARSLLEGLRA
jgi:predicted phosphoribosyltransferase